MKIITDKAVYVQKNDMAYLNQTDLPIPAAIYMKVFGRGITIIDNDNRYEFVKFTAPEEIEYFRSLDWLIDYNALKDLTEEELIAFGTEVGKEKKQRIDEFNAKPEKERKAQYGKALASLDLFDYKMYSIRDLIMFKKGELEFALPKGIKKTAIIVAEEQAEEVTSELSSSEPKKSKSGIKQFIKTILGNGKKQ